MRIVLVGVEVQWMEKKQDNREIQFISENFLCYTFTSHRRFTHKFLSTVSHFFFRFVHFHFSFFIGMRPLHRQAVQHRWLMNLMNQLLDKQFYFYFSACLFIGSKVGSQHKKKMPFTKRKLEDTKIFLSLVLFSCWFDAATKQEKK